MLLDLAFRSSTRISHLSTPAYQLAIRFPTQYESPLLGDQITKQFYNERDHLLFFLTAFQFNDFWTRAKSITGDRRTHS